MKEIAASNPNSIFGKDRTIPLREAVNYSSIEELKETLINEEIDKAQRESFESQIKWIISKVEGMEDFTPRYTEWPTILEIFERRNLFVHANGIVNDHYIRAKKKHKFGSKDEKNIGDELHAGPKYFRASVHHTIHFGAMLLQVIWRKLAPDETEDADESISNLGFELIARGQYRLAARILEFASSLRDVSDDAHMRMNVINLANAYKLAGDNDTSKKVLDSKDWSAAAPEFRVCVSAVQDNIGEVVSFMKKMGKDGDVTPHDYQSWPAFYGVRDEPIFIESFKAVFGIDYIPAAKKQAGIAQVLEWFNSQQSEATANDTVPTIVISESPNRENEGLP